MTGNRTQETQIRTLVDDWAGAMRNRDAERVVAFGAPEFIQFSLAPPLIATDADVNGLKAWFATWKGPLGFEVRDLHVTAGDDVAFCFFLSRLQGTDTDGETTDLWFRQTLCFRKIGDAWKIVHAHESVPFYMDGSFRAALDLKP
jgi:PhnB protein